MDSLRAAGIDAEHLTDLGNARRLVKQFGEDLRYVAGRDQYYIWAGSHWGT